MVDIEACNCIGSVFHGWGWNDWSSAKEEEIKEHSKDQLYQYRFLASGWSFVNQKLTHQTKYFEQKGTVS